VPPASTKLKFLLIFQTRISFATPHGTSAAGTGNPPRPIMMVLATMETLQIHARPNLSVHSRAFSVEQPGVFHLIHNRV
jgi:hypothetical protein